MLDELLESIDWELVYDSTIETIQMILFALPFIAAIGIPLGLTLFLTSKGQPLANARVYRTLSFLINVLRSTPFIILLIVVIPITRFVTGTILGVPGVIPPLVISASPFLARLIENVIREIDQGIIEAMRSMGATTWQIVRYAIIPESLPGIVGALTVTSVAVLGYTAMAGVVGAGGLGDVAIRYGYNRYEPGMLYITVPILIVIVQLIQTIGDTFVRRLNHK